MAKDLYEILGVPKTATDDEIKKAYRKLAIKLHPDRFATASDEEKKKAEAQFKEINHAYEVLSDKNKRANYDQYGSEEGPQGFGGFGGGGFDGSGGGFGGFEDILSSFFGGSFGRKNPNAPKQGEDIHIKINLTFEEAYNGASKTVKLNRDETCTTCGGSGKIVGDKCAMCRGNGYMRKEASIKVNIPAGVDNGVTMTIRNEGNCGRNGGGKGNLVIAIGVTASDKFRRVGNDLYMDLPIGYYDAACGNTITINTMKGEAKCKIPESTQSGTKIRLKGYGMKVLQKESYGDLYVIIKVETPKGLNAKQLKLLKDFEDSLQANQYPQVKKARG